MLSLTQFYVSVSGFKIVHSKEKKEKRKPPEVNRNSQVYHTQRVGLKARSARLSLVRFGVTNILCVF